MKKIMFLALAVLGCNVHSHAQNCDSIARVDIIDKIKNYSPEDILPYYDKDSRMWGYMTKEGKILTKPLNNSPYGLLFNPNVLVSYENCEITIKGEDYSFYAKPAFANIFDGKWCNPKLINKGFEVDTATNEITAIAPKYYDLFYTLFKYQGKYYAIMRLKSTGKQGIIDREENILPNFDFKYKYLDFNRCYKDKHQLWFYFEDKNGNTGFKNLKGKVKFYNQLLSTPSPLPYYEQYSLQNNAEQSGIFDLENLEWIIKPQSKVEYTDVVHVGLDPEKQTVYIIIEKGEDKYLIDLQGRKYKPKK